MLAPLNRILCTVIIILICHTANSQSIYKTPTGKKYHLANCSTVKNVSEKITIEEAKELGLEPCKVCHPQDIYAGAYSSGNKAVGQGSATVQCKGITKAGTRCKHMTRMANGYCFQHNPG